MADAPTGGTPVEEIKGASNQLRGTIGEDLAAATPTFSTGNAQLLKFHGIYQQDDRDVRAERTRQGLDVDHICMVRVSIPGGMLTPPQYLTLDRLAGEVGNGSLRVTTRQGLQFHFVRKGDLRPLIAGLHDQLVTTLGACGDVVRNTMCCPAPLADRRRAAVEGHVHEIANHFRPHTRAYHDIWIDGEPAPAGPAPADAEPIYGRHYLPRKFKIGFAFPGDNCVDVYTHDVGVVPVIGGDTGGAAAIRGTVRAFTMLVGGGQGRSHTNPDTFPRMADPLTTVAPGELLGVIDAIVAVQRDHGNRVDREHARLKYLIHDWGLDRFRGEVVRRLGRPLPPPEPVVLHEAADHLGWHDQGDGRWFLGVKVENGRIIDRPGVRMRSALRAVVARVGASVHLTPREDVLLTNVRAGDRPLVDDLLAEHGVRPAGEWVGLERHAFACPALPTCGLALAESERALPGVLAELGSELAGLGLSDLDAHVRMTGCPNGCARPYTAEIGFVGRGKHRYDIHLGGEPVGRRLNGRFAENVPRQELVNVLRPVLVDYRDRRAGDERFGDWCDRVGVGELRRRLGDERWVRRPRAAAVAGAATEGSDR